MKKRNTRKILIGIALSGALITGCTTKETTIGDHLPVRVYIAPELPSTIQQTVLLPPLGIKDPALREKVRQKLYQGARRHFVNPLQVVNPDSSYANYITEKNLVTPDGTLNTSEVVIIGELMDVSHVICPMFLEIRPYPPQKISILVTVIDVKTGNVAAELSGTFDARDRDIRDWFGLYTGERGADYELEQEIDSKLLSPSEFQAFVADSCFSLLRENLPL